MRSSRYSDVFRSSPRRRAFTLVEVVVGLTLLASLVVGVLLSFRVHHRQLRNARQRMAAATMADELLSVWHGRPEGVPPQAQGGIASAPGWVWQTQPIARRLVAGLPVDVIRLDVFAPRSAADTAPLSCSVEVIRPASSLAGGGPR